MTNIRGPRALALTLGASLVLASCGSSGEAEPSAGPAGEGGGGSGAPAAELTVGLTYTPDVQFAPFYLAVETGAFERAGVDVTLRHHGANESLFGALQAGQEDVVFAGGDEMMQARDEGVPVLAFATMYQEHPVVLIVPADSPIRSAADLAGRSVGLPGPFGETWFGLLAMLQEAGLSQDEVDVQHIGYTQQQALQTGAVDAIVGFSNNDAVQLEEAGVPVRTIPVTEGPTPLVAASLGATGDSLDEDAQDHARVLEALREVMAGPAQDTEEVLKATGQYVPGLADPAAADRARATWEATLPLYGEPRSVGAIDVPAWEAMSEFMAQAGLVADRVPAQEAMTTRVVELLE